MWASVSFDHKCPSDGDFLFACTLDFHHCGWNNCRICRSIRFFSSSRLTWRFIVPNEFIFSSGGSGRRPLDHVLITQFVICHQRNGHTLVWLSVPLLYKWESNYREQKGTVTVIKLVCGRCQFQLLVHVPVRQADGAVQVEESSFGSEL